MNWRNTVVLVVLFSLYLATVLLSSIVFSFSSPLIKWNQTYGGNGAELAYFVEQTDDYGYIFAGYTGSYGAGSVDFWLVKTNSTGSLEWNSTFGGSSRDEAYSVQQTGDGGYVVAGYTGSFGAGYEDFWLVKTDSNGNEVWNKTFGGVYDDMAFSVQQTGDGGYVVAGYTGSFGAGYEDFWLVKTDSNGNEVWNKTFGGENSDFAYSTQQTNDEGYIIVGSSYLSVVDQFDVWLVKTDSLGNMQWNQTIGWAGDDEAFSVKQTSDGGYVIVANSNSFSSNSDIWTIKTDSYGNIEWSRVFGGLEKEEASFIQQTSDDGYIVVGTHYFFAGNPDALLIRFAGTNDGAVTNIEPFKAFVGEGYLIDINVTIKNWGTSIQTFNITVKANMLVVGTEETSLVGGNNITIKFTWDTLSCARGDYRLVAYVTPILGETETYDNTLVDGIVKIVIPGDVNGDGIVELLDFFLTSQAAGSYPGHPNWNPNADINNDYIVELTDFFIISLHVGES